MCMCACGTRGGEGRRVKLMCVEGSIYVYGGKVTVSMGEVYVPGLATSLSLLGLVDVVPPVDY